MTMTTTLTNTAFGQPEPAGTAEPRPFTLRNAHGMQLAISERGAALVSWWAPDRYRRSADVLLGYREPQDYSRLPIATTVHPDPMPFRNAGASPAIAKSANRQCDSFHSAMQT
jgi:hypothetical protein